MIRNKDCMIFTGKKFKMEKKKKVFTNGLDGIVHNQNNWKFKDHLYVFGTDQDPKNKKYEITYLKQIDKSLNEKKWNITRKDKVKILEITWLSNDLGEFFGILYSDYTLKVVGFKKNEFANQLILEESSILDKVSVRNIRFKSVSPKTQSAELLFLSRDTIYTIKLQRSGGNSQRTTALKSINGDNFEIENTQSQLLYYPVTITEKGKEEFLICKWDMGSDQNKNSTTRSNKEEFFELSGKCWEIALYKHLILVITRVSANNKGRHDELKIIDPITGYIAFRFVPSDSRLISLIIDQDIHIWAAEKQNKEVIKTIKEMEDNDKIDKFVKKNSLKLAYQFAKHSGFKPKFLAQLSRVAGDKELDRGKYSEAMEHFKNTIGFLEPSYVLQRFIEKGQVAFNIEYLLELFHKGQADKYHVQLLVNCLLEKKKFTALREWFGKLQMKQSHFAELAIDACLEYGEPQLAKNLAQESERTDFYVQIVIDNFLSGGDQTVSLKETSEILNHIRNINSNKGESASWIKRKESIIEYGPILKKFDSEGVLKLVIEAIEFFINTPSENSVQELLYLYREFEEQQLTQSETLIAFLNKQLKKLTNQDKSVVCEFIIEFYSKRFGVSYLKIQREYTKSSFSKNNTSKESKWKVEDVISEAAEEENRDSEPNNNNLRKRMSFFNNFNQKEEFNSLWVSNADETTKQILAQCEAQVKKMLDDPEINRLVDLHYLLNLFSQCYMREAKLKVLDLLQLKSEKLRNLFFNSDYQRCSDYCQKNFKDCQLNYLFLKLICENVKEEESNILNAFIPQILENLQSYDNQLSVYELSTLLKKNKYLKLSQISKLFRILLERKKEKITYLENEIDLIKRKNEEDLKEYNNLKTNEFTIEVYCNLIETKKKM